MNVQKCFQNALRNKLSFSKKGELNKQRLISSGCKASSLHKDKHRLFILPPDCGSLTLESQKPKWGNQSQEQLLAKLEDSKSRINPLSSDHQSRTFFTPEQLGSEFKKKEENSFGFESFEAGVQIIPTPCSVFSSETLS